MAYDQSKFLSTNPAFLQWLGFYFVAWSAAEGIIEFIIVKLLRITYEEGHLLLTGRDFGRKARLLHGLLQRSEHPKKGEMIGHLRKIENSKRNLLAHSSIRSSATQVVFVDRNTSGNYEASERPFTYEEFVKLATELSEAGAALQAAFPASDEDTEAFSKAALSANLKPKTSPAAP